MATTFHNFDRQCPAIPGEPAGIPVIRAEMLALLEKLDELDLRLAAAHLQAAIDCLEGDRVVADSL